MITVIRLICLCSLLCTPPAFGGVKAEYGSIELLRDTWGVPHVFSDTDDGAMYGLGYATAEDRGLQMTYNLRVIQGRLSEVIGEVRMLNRNETSIDHDRKMRTFSFYRGAQRTVANLDPETLTLLEAYCHGVNDSFAAQRAAGTLHPLFAQLELVPEPWTPADCLAVWWHVAQFFATDGTRDLIARRTRDQPAPDRAVRNQASGRDGGRGEAERGTPILPSDVTPLPPDESPSVVKRGDVSEEWIAALQRYAEERGLRRAEVGADGAKFSHAWVVGGKRTTTGSSVLVSDPQTPVRNPSLFYQFHIQGKTFNARGMGVPGNPAFLIGFTEHVAWGVTAMGADQADLFLLDTDPARPDQYRFDGEWQPMTVHREEIRVKGRGPMPFVVRETRLGPVATAFAFARPEEGEVALKRVPVCEEERDTIQGAVAMMRARNAHEFNAALEGWRFPSANIVFGDREGNIGYKALAAIPVRSRLDPDFGRIAMPGHSSGQDWQEILPYDLLPQVMNPAAGLLFSGNHRAIESWYPIPIFGMTGSGGDTVRSWRLRERLEAKERFTPEEVLEIHYDSVNPARRDIVRIGLHLRDKLGHEFTEEARNALARLEPWYREGTSSALTSEGAEVAVELNTFFRVMSTDLAFLYGGGESGLSYFLKTATTRLNDQPQVGFSPVERHFVEQALAGAWRSARQKYGLDPTDWNAKARMAVEQRKLGYMESLDGFPSLAPNLDLAFPPLTVTDGGTIISQASQSYTQWVPMHDPDQALAILPIGQSERPDSPFRTSTMELWSRGRLHPAPLSRETVEPITVSRQRLHIDPQSAPEMIGKGNLTPGKFHFRHHLIDTGLAGNGFGQTALADLTGDGRLEFIMGRRGGPLYVYRYEAPERWTRHVVGQDSPSDVGLVVLDVDGDGRLDLVAGGAWYRNSGSLEQPFERIVFDAQLTSVHDIVAADVNGDNRLDVLVMSDRHNLRWYRIPSDPRRPWQAQDIGPAVHAGLAVGDLNGNGRTDVVRTDVWFENVRSDGTEWRSFDIGPNTPPPPDFRPYFAFHATRAWVLDMNGNGRNDIVFTDAEIPGGQVWWMENPESRDAPWRRHNVFTGGEPRRGAFHTLQVADFDGDGDPDIFTCEMEHVRGRNEPRWYIWENMDGLGNAWKEHVILDANLGGHEALAGDITGNGRLDIIGKPWHPHPQNAVGGQMFVVFLENISNRVP